MKEKRVYPSCCTSMYCGEIKCPKDCKFLPHLKEFKSWVEKKKAVVTDETWSPTVYVATID